MRDRDTLDPAKPAAAVDAASGNAEEVVAGWAATAVPTGGPVPRACGKSPMLTAGDRSDVAANGSAVADSAGVWFTDPNTPLVVLKMPLNSNLTTAVPNNSN